MPLWSWWLSAAALAAVPIAHWFLLGRGLAVSGRYSVLIDRIRFGASDDGASAGGADEAFDQAALIEALRAQTVAEFGADALEPEPVEPDASGREESPSQGPLAAPALAAMRAPQSTFVHGLFLLGLTLGGTLSALLAGQFDLRAGLHGETFGRVVGALSLPAPALLVVGGLCVGFGTRMAGGCTSGHGLCGVSQLQLGSLTSTAAFFGAGVATSFALGALL